MKVESLSFYSVHFLLFLYDIIWSFMGVALERYHNRNMWLFRAFMSMLKCHWLPEQLLISELACLLTEVKALANVA